MIRKLLNYISLLKLRKQWRKCNLHNFTYAKNQFNINDVTVGKATYGGIKVLNDVPGLKLKVGNFCSIAEDVIFLLGCDHRIDCLSTYPYKYHIFKNAKYEAVSKGEITIGDDVWIGQHATILSGVNIGQGAVIASGAIVVHDVPAYSIVAGAPARVVKYRFNSDIINKLMEIDYSRVCPEKLINIEDNLYTAIDETNVKVIVDKLKSTYY